MDELRVTVLVLILSRSEPAALEDRHLGAVELNCARMRKKVRDLVAAHW